MAGFLPRSVAGAALVAGLVAGCGSETARAPSIAAGSSVLAPTTMGTDSTVPPTSATTAAPPGRFPVRPPMPPPEEQCVVAVMSWAPGREILTVTFSTSVPAAVVLARATDSGAVTSSTSMTDIHGEGHARLKVAREPVGRPVQVDISAAGGAKACSIVFEVTSAPIQPMHGGMP
jgi:hypothetical protein